ncbi:MAG: TldD/PmbA family protein [Pseudomonadota bacterium]
MTRSLSDLSETLLGLARKAGADAADVVAIDGAAVSIDVLGGKLEQAERAEGVDLGLRVLVGQRQACVSTSLIDPDALQEVAERAVFMAREAPEDPYIGLAEDTQLSAQRDAAGLDLHDDSPEPEASALEEDARRAEAAALAITGVTQVQSASASYSNRRIHLATSGGFSGGYRRSSRSTSCVAITGEGSGMERDYFGESRIYQADLPDPETIGRIAGERTVARAGARKPKTGAYPVIFEERIAASLIGHLLSAANGAMIARGSSWLKDTLGTKILPKGFDLIEEPRRPRVSGSRPFDGEGLPTAERAIVKDGVLQGWTLDLANARKLGMTSTGNASRGTGGPPSPSLTNVALKQGPQSLDDMLKDMGTGLLVTSMIGSTINPNTGDYSRGASGFWVEKGELAYPVNECTLAGNLLDMLKTIRPANDARTHLSRIVPSLAVEGLILAGD